jgi:hypothetical protein
MAPNAPPRATERGSKVPVARPASHTMANDPWGTLAMVGVIAVGAGLMFVPGILIGAASSAGCSKRATLVALANLGGHSLALTGGSSRRAVMDQWCLPAARKR